MSPTRIPRLLVASALLFILAALLSGARLERPSATTAPGEPAARVQILAVNDLHGALEPGMVGMRPAGGVATLAAYLNARRGAAPHSITVHAGDMIGGSPPISSLLREEPTMEAMDLLDIELGSVGNHEFDRGLAELYRLVHGGCDAHDNCFPGARTQYLAANVVNERTGETVFPPYAVRMLDGVSVGFIGVTLEETASIVVPTRVAGLRFLNEVETVNRYAAELKGMGVRAIVVLLHKGGEGAMGGMIQGMQFSALVAALDDEVDVVISGHSHRGYQGMVGNKLVTQAFSRGTAFADIDLVIDRATGDVTSRRAAIVTTFADALPPDPSLVRRVEQWRELVRPLTERVVGVAAEDIERVQETGAEDPVANLIADAFRWQMGSEIGCLNAGGWRADIKAGPVTWGELYEVQPFGNELVMLELTGGQLERVLNQQWTNQPNLRIMRCSGLVYTWDPSAPEESRVTLADMALADGTPIEADRLYTVTVNNFLAEGGHNLTVLQESPTRVPGPTDIEALVAYVEQLPQPFTSRVEGRIRTRTQERISIPMRRMAARSAGLAPPQGHSNRAMGTRRRGSCAASDVIRTSAAFSRDRTPAAGRYSG